MASIFRTAEGTWRAQVRRGGHRLTKNFTRKVDASAWAALQETDIERGTAGLPGKPSGTLGELIREYHKIVYPLKRYGRSKVYELDSLARDLGDLPVAALTTARVVEYALGLRPRLSSSSIQTRVTYLREALRGAADLWNAAVPIAQVDAAMAALKRQKVTAKPPPRTRRATDAELEAVIAFHRTQRSAGIDLPAVINVLRVLPLRVGELLKIEWADLDAGSRTVKLRARKHPDVTVRETNDTIIPLPVIGGTDTWELIAGRPRFLPKPFPFIRTAVSSAFSYAAHCAHVENLHLHDLRAFSISRLIEAGVAVPMIAHLSGHKSWKLLQSVYTRLDPAEVARAIEKAAA
jgi:integrase